MDNFSEVEHTVAMHPAFGFDPARGGEAAVTFEPAEDAVTVHNAGPAKPPLPLAQLLLMFRRRFLFHSDYVLHYDPPRAVVEHHWCGPCRRPRRRGTLPAAPLLRPGGRRDYAARDFWRSPVALAAAQGRRAADGLVYAGGHGSTIDEDVRLLENLADQDPDIEGMKLGRFDRVLGP